MSAKGRNGRPAVTKGTDMRIRTALATVALALAAVAGTAATAAAATDPTAGLNNATKCLIPQGGKAGVIGQGGADEQCAADFSLGGGGHVGAP